LQKYPIDKYATLQNNTEILLSDRGHSRVLFTITIGRYGPYLIRKNRYCEMKSWPRSINKITGDPELNGDNLSYEECEKLSALIRATETKNHSPEEIALLEFAADYFDRSVDPFFDELRDTREIEECHAIIV